MNTTACEIKFLKNELGVINERNMFFLKTNDNLRKKIESLTKDLERFIKGRQNINILLGNQQFSNEKSGLSFTGFVKNRKYDSYFIKDVASSYTHLTCFYYNHKEHVSRFCTYKEGFFKFFWVPKSTKLFSETNLSRPKIVWVPKTN